MGLRPGRTTSVSCRRSSSIGRPTAPHSPAGGHIVGNADVFEATFRVAVIDAGGKTLVDRQVMATCGSGCRGTFDVTAQYKVTKAQWGTLRAYNPSAKDGSPEDVREYPVWLTPGG